MKKRTTDYLALAMPATHARKGRRKKTTDFADFADPVDAAKGVLSFAALASFA